MQTGWGKLNDIGKVVNFFSDLGIPAPALNAYFVSELEFGGSVLLILGLASRLIAVPLVIDMIVAYITADRVALFSIISAPDKFTGRAVYRLDYFSDRADRPWQGVRGRVPDGTARAAVKCSELSMAGCRSPFKIESF
jgi:hypothetical protein